MGPWFSGLEMDGISMVPELTGGKQPEHHHLYWEFPVYGGRQAVRMGHWKGVRYNLAEGNRDVELYNLEADPGETKNVAAENPEIAEEIRTLMSSSREPSEIFELPLDD